MIIIRYLPLLEKLVSVVFSDYEEWRKKYDEQRIKDKVAKSIKSDSTKDLNDEIDKDLGKKK